MKSIVTGSSGFIGNRLCLLLEEQGHEVIKVSRKIKSDSKKDLVCDLETTSLEDKNLSDVRTIFHLAGYAHDLSNPENSKDKYYSLNVKATLNLATQASENGVEKFVFISSVKAESPSVSRGKVEDKELGIYGETKRKAELLLLELSQKTDMQIHIIRPSLVYGPNVKGNLLNMKVAIEKGWFPPIPRINNFKSMIHVDDLARAIVFVAKEGIDKEIYNVTDGVDYSTTEIYETLCRLVEKKPPSLRIPLFAFELLAKVPSGLGHKVKKLLESERFSSGKIRSLGYYSKLKLKQFNETLF
jgi:UDP-glucose 4-epimerase